MLKKLNGPGLFRLFLALLVFVHHTSRAAFGSLAVYVFFCLSGFWIYKMYTERYAATRQPYLTFLVSRCWRLLPTFWLISAITLCYLLRTGDLAKYYQADNHLLFGVAHSIIFGYNSLDMQPVGPAWSLDIEMQFYLLAPLLAIVLARRIVPAKWILLSVAIFSGASAALGLHRHLFTFLIFFVIGMISASTEWKPAPRLVAWSSTAMLLLAAGCMASPWRGMLLIGTHRGPLAVYADPANAVLAFLAVPYAIYTTGQRGFANDHMFGDLSYVVYLLHWPATLLLVSFVQQGLAGVPRLLATALDFVIVMGFSVVIWKFYDKPINRMRAHWVKSRRKQAHGLVAEPVG